MPSCLPFTNSSASIREVPEALLKDVEGGFDQRRNNGHTTTNGFLRSFAPSSSDLDIDNTEEGWCCCEPLNTTERVLGWITCFLGGLVISAGSMGSLNDMLLGKSNKFALTYTLGNIIGLVGTCFLVGPVQQFQNMADKSRMITSIVFILSLVFTILSAGYLQLAFLTIIFVCIQWLAYTWYALSYIPYGQSALMWVFRRIVPS